MNNYPKTALNQVKRGANRAVYEKEKVHDILKAGFLGYVSYTFEGTAMAMPMAYGFKDDTLYLHGSLKNRMLSALLASGKGSITIMHLDGLVLARSGLHHSVNYRSATLFGPLERVDDLVEKEEILKCVVDQMVPGRWEALRPISTKELKATLVVAMAIETASVKIRDVGVQDEKRDMELSIWAGIVPLRQVASDPVSDDQLATNVEVPEHVLAYCEANR